MDRFLDEKACVRVNRDELHDFLLLCEYWGLQWIDGDSPTSFESSMRFSGDKVTIGRSAPNGNLLYSEYGICHNGMQMIDYSELNIPKPDPVPLDLSFLTE